MTQPEILLEILKQNATTGITAEGIREHAWLPQYNRVIKDLRRQGHVIISWKRPEAFGFEFRFYFCGSLKSGWWRPSSFYPMAVAERAEIAFAGTKAA